MDKKKPNIVKNSSSGTKTKQQTSSTASKTTSRSNTNTTEACALETSSPFQSYILFWLDPNITMEDNDCQVTIAHLQSAVSTVHVFNDADQCADFLNKTKNEKVFLVVSGAIGQNILPRIHNMSQLAAVFIFCSNRQKYESLIKSWPKVRGIFTDISVLSQSVKEVARQYEEDLIDISLFSTSDLSNQSLDHLDQSFMYTKLIKEIILKLDHDNDCVKKLVTYCCNKYRDNEEELKHIEKFKNGYKPELAILWYTYESCIYKTLNWALREQEFDVIIRMAFFISDLHRYIEKSYEKQLKTFPEEFVLYRGQGLESEKFEKLKKAKGGLLSFNNFLSTSTTKEVAMKFGNKALQETRIIGILFIITVNRSVPSTPFASVDKDSYYGDSEKEILFSMQSVFRIRDIKQSHDNDRIWEVYLTLTSDNDPQLNQLTDRIRTEIEGSTPLYRLGALMIKVGEFDKAQEIYKTLLERTSDECEKANIYYQLGYINDNQQKYDQALIFYKDALNTFLKHFSPDHPNIAACYNNIGLVYDNKNDYQKALPFYEEALKIYLKTLPHDHPNVATTYNSIGLIFNSLGNYTQALLFCQKALDIFEKCLPSNHITLATSHNNIGLVYANMKKYPEALASHKRAVEIAQETLPRNHPNLQVFKQNFESLVKKNKK